MALVITSMCLSAPALAQPAASPSSNAPESRLAGDRLLPLEVFINSSKGGVWTLLERKGVLHAPDEAFEEWRLSHRPSAQGIEFQGQKWYALSAIPGFEARLNFATQSIDLVFSPSAFNDLRLTQEVMPRPPSGPSQGIQASSR